MQKLFPSSPKLSEYTYNLPEDRIAKHPLKKRDDSKLLVYKGGHIEHRNFQHVSRELPQNSTLFFNNTRVIPARLFFYKETGAKIEIFLLKPTSTASIAQAMEARDKVSWHVMVGNSKKWKNNEILYKELTINNLNVTVSIKRSISNENIVAFDWTTAHSDQILFCDIIEAAGRVPLPPYLNREATKEDKPRYQTVYSKHEGAVAAPTAGLHFTQSIFNDLKAKGIDTNFLTLHVSAGTFQPIKEEKIVDHPMHLEQLVIKRDTLKSLFTSKKIVAVGTTSMRTLESLYWYGVKLLKGLDKTFHIEKLFAYQFNGADLPDRRSSFNAVLDYMKDLNLEEIGGSTEIFIFPGYTFRVCEGLITNYHQPGSTLIFLVAAFVGERWKEIYDQALENDYRFLSYGDSALLLP